MIKTRFTGRWENRTRVHSMTSTKGTWNMSKQSGSWLGKQGWYIYPGADEGNAEQVRRKAEKFQWLENGKTGESGNIWRASGQRTGLRQKSWQSVRSACLVFILVPFFNKGWFPAGESNLYIAEDNKEKNRTNSLRQQHIEDTFQSQHVALKKKIL